MFSWGGASSGQLGLGAIEEDAVFTPRPVKLPDSISTEITSIGCGREHTVLTTKDGCVYSCGSADYGQTGHETGSSRLKLLSGLETLSVKIVACGSHHTVALTMDHLVYTWGDGREGQLGREVKGETYRTPRLVKRFSDAIIDVCCGDKHNLALSVGAQVYTWGSNSHCQLGIGFGVATANEPKYVPTLDGLPIVQVAAGGCHSMALTVTGIVYSWGKNDFGQLGLGDNLMRHVPTWVTTLKSVDVCRICCGGDHTALLTKITGALFTFGSNGTGQLGHNSTSHSLRPKQVVELMGDPVIQVACGRQHTIALTAFKFQVHSFGLGGSGQLGIESLKLAKLPTVISLLEQVNVQKIFAGGSQSFALVSSHRMDQPDWTPEFLSEKLVMELVEEAEESRQFGKLARIVGVAFGSWSILSGSFIKQRDVHCTQEWCPGVDMESIRRTLSRLASIQEVAFQLKVSDCIRAGLRTAMNRQLPEIWPEEHLRPFVILPECHFFRQPEMHIALIGNYMETFLRLKQHQHCTVGQWYKKLGAVFFGPFVNVFVNCLSCILSSLKNSLTHEALVSFPDKELFENCIDTLSILNWMNEIFGNLIPFETFYSKQLNEAKEFDLAKDYFRAMQLEPGISLSRYSFLFNSQTKSKLLDLDARFQMQHAVNHAQRYNIDVLTQNVEGQHFLAEPFLVFRIRRSQLLQDTLNEVAKYTEEQKQSGHHVFKKPLHVQFDNEEGMDAGGVKKEFFLLLVRELFNPDFGMFNVLPESNVTWFFEQSYEELRMFEMVGIICGLAIYNAVILRTSFPLVIYRKLLKRNLKLGDLKEIQPSLAESLQSMLDYEEDDFEDTFGLTFQITRTSFGQTQSFDLIPDGANTIVTKENRGEYVKLYVDFLLNKAIESQFNAFNEGFRRVCSGHCWEFFRAKELMSIAAGSPVFDLMEMDQVTEYRNGYFREHRSIVYFWHIVDGLGDTLKKKFFIFLTGSDRVPITGIKNMQFIIQRCDSGPNANRLPVAHTCFNILDLPDYGSEQTLRNKLILAITHTSGFGLV